MSSSTDETRSRASTLLRHPFFQSVCAGIVGMTLIVVVSIVASQRAGENVAMREARELTAVVAQTVVGPNMSAGLLAGDPAELARLDEIVRERVLRGTTARVKLWDAEGRVIYSDEQRLIGEIYPLDGDKVASLWSGKAVSEISDLQGPENRFEADQGRLLEVYLPVPGPDDVPLLYESYFDYSVVEGASARIRNEFLPIVIGSLLIAQILHLVLAWTLHRRLNRSQRERELLLQRAIDSSDLARRRIAGDLHDGVVQDLVATSYAMSAAAEMARQEGSPELAGDLRMAAANTRRGLQSLRSLLVDIYPANLRTQGLADAISDLLAPADSLGIAAECEIDGRVDASIEHTALVYRVVRESVRNVFRHADASCLHVKIRGDDHGLSAAVIDDGRGFDTASALLSDSEDDGHIGLRLITDLAADAGAELLVESGVGEGTRVLLDVPR